MKKFVYLLIQLFDLGEVIFTKYQKVYVYNTHIHR